MDMDAAFGACPHGGLCPRCGDKDGYADTCDCPTPKPDKQKWRRVNWWV